MYNIWWNFPIYSTMSISYVYDIHCSVYLREQVFFFIPHSRGLIQSFLLKFGVKEWYGRVLYTTASKNLQNYEIDPMYTAWKYHSCSLKYFEQFMIIKIRVIWKNVFSKRLQHGQWLTVLLCGDKSNNRSEIRNGNGDPWWNFPINSRMFISYV